MSFGTKTVDGWLERGGGAETWSLGFPAVHVARYVWTSDEARVRLGGDPSQRSHPPAPPELEDCFEAMRKALRCACDRDTEGLRWHARDAAERMPGLLLGLNPPRAVHDRREALEAALTLQVAPAGWSEDLATLLGVRSSGDDEVATALRRLSLGLLQLLRDRHPDVDPQPGLRKALTSGTLERLLTETAG